eukprot:6198181-Pleurochrysis_carterae.AAC.1
MFSNARRMNFQFSSPATAKMGYSGLNQEVNSEVLVQEEELCLPVLLMTNAAMMPFRLVLPKDDDV